MKSIRIAIDNIDNEEYMINIINKIVDNDEEVLFKDRYYTAKGYARKFRKINIRLFNKMEKRGLAKKEKLLLESNLLKYREVFLDEMAYQYKRLRFVNYIDYGNRKSDIPIIWYVVTEEERKKIMKSRHYATVDGVIIKKKKKFDTWQIFFRTGEGEEAYSMIFVCRTEQIWEERILPIIKIIMNKDIRIEIEENDTWIRHKLQ